jgi:hypothetical protein
MAAHYGREIKDFTRASRVQLATVLVQWCKDGTTVKGER